MGWLATVITTSLALWAGLISAQDVAFKGVTKPAPEDRVKARKSPKFPLDGNHLFADLHTAAMHCPFKNPEEIRAVKE